MSYLVESERHAIGYVYGLIFKFGSVGPDAIGSGSDGYDPDPKFRFQEMWIRSGPGFVRCTSYEGEDC
jgi:hypothetical protein